MTVHASATIDTNEATDTEPVTTRRPIHRKGNGLVKFIISAAVLAGVVGGTYQVLGKEKSLEVVKYVREQVIGPEPGDATVPADHEPPKPAGPWDHLVKVTPEERKAIGFKITPVEPQRQPIELEINGTTDYDLNSLKKVRPRFDNALVTNVLVSAGQHVKKGQPLLELRSAELGQARNDCRTAYVQWEHDLKYMKAREPLAKDGRITQIVWTDTVNSEKQSRLNYFVSRDKLLTYGMTDEQINKLLEGLMAEGVGEDHDKNLKPNVKADDITWMTVCCPIDGIVVERDVVPDNFYDQKDILLTISPMTELWVWGNVFESDQDKVHLGQKWDIELQFSKEHFVAEVESIANGVDPDTRTLRIRASIDNRGKELKARMLVRAKLQIPPREGDTVIPRNALATINGEFYAFVQKGDSGADADSFERRTLEIDQENTDLVIVKKGLKAGDRVVSNGALILSQMYEDASTMDSGLPAQ